MEPDTTTLQVIAENYGLPGMVLFSLVLLLAFLSVGLPRLITAIKGKNGDHAPAPAPARITETMIGRITASQLKGQAKEQTDETQDGEISKLRAEVLQLRGRLDDAFEVVGKIRGEVKEARNEARETNDKLEKKHEKLRDKCDLKNEKQDNLIGGLSQSFSVLQGMMQARKGSTGGTGMFINKPTISPDSDKK